MSGLSYQRRSLRLKGYDYTSRGMYFVTICAWQRQELFGHLDKQRMYLNDAGHVVHREWLRSMEIRSEITIDEFVVMPNHIHGIVVIKNDMNTVGAHGRAPLQGLYRPPRSLGSLIAGFKSATTKQINVLRESPGLPVWQRNYYEHVIRHELELNRIREYVLDNPRNWTIDEYHAI